MIGTLLLPFHVLIIPQYMLFRRLDLVDTFVPLLLGKFLAVEAFFVFLMVQFIRGLPKDLDEAARIDGCGHFRIFFNVLLPLMVPAIATTAIFTFIWSYNDLFLQTVLLRSRKLLPVCAILREISSQYGTDFGLMAAAVTIVVIPVLLVYILMQKNIIKGLTAGAVKG